MGNCASSNEYEGNEILALQKQLGVAENRLAVATRDKDLALASELKYFVIPELEKRILILSAPYM